MERVLRLVRETVDEQIQKINVVASDAEKEALIKMALKKFAQIEVALVNDIQEIKMLLENTQ